MSFSDLSEDCYAGWHEDCDVGCDCDCHEEFGVVDEDAGHGDAPLITPDTRGLL